MAIWGVADPTPAALSYGTASAADVTLTAGSEVTIITTGALVALNPGPYYPLIWLTVAVILGATAPTALQFAFRLGAGSDVDTYVVEPGMLVNLAEFTLGIPLVGLNSAAAWIGSGSTVNVTGKATTTACTVKGVGTRALVQLMRGPDL